MPSQPHTLPIHSKLLLHHSLSTPAMDLTHPQTLLLTFPIVTQLMPLFMNSQTQKVGSGTQEATYCIGFPQTAVAACTHRLYLLSLGIPVFDLSPFPLMALPLGILGPKFSTVNMPSFFTFIICWMSCLLFTAIQFPFPSFTNSGDGVT